MSMLEQNSKNSIEVFSLTKKFGQFVAVNDVSFSVKKGEIFGFLGANGAGKSTTIRMLCGLLRPSSGKAKVGGYDIVTQSEKVKETIGYMSQKFSLYEDLTVEENIRFFGGVYGLSRPQLKPKISWALEMAGLGGRKKALARDLAVGWKQRLALGCALLHEPRIVFLDEPTGGVDPVSRRKFWDLISRLSESGVTVFVTTHYLDEAEYCHRIMLMHAGSLIAGGSPEDLKNTCLQHPILEVECDEAIKAMELLQMADWVIETSVFGTYLHVSVADEAEGRSRITAALLKNNIVVKRIDRIAASLEDAFLHLIEEKTHPQTGET
jgi:ABC-2 type transport system ATP-binding protein